MATVDFIIHRFLMIYDFNFCTSIVNYSSTKLKSSKFSFLRTIRLAERNPLPTVNQYAEKGLKFNLLINW